MPKRKAEPGGVEPVGLGVAEVLVGGGKAIGLRVRQGEGIVERAQIGGHAVGPAKGAVAARLRALANWLDAFFLGARGW